MAKRNRSVTRQDHRRLWVEALEPRWLLAADFELLKNISPEPGTLGSDPELLTVAGDMTYFVANGAIWKTDGTTEGTSYFTSIDAGSRTSYQALAAVGDTLYIFAKDPDALFPNWGTQVWVSDGTPDGTQILGSSERKSLSSQFRSLAVGDTLYFVFDEGVHGYELWKSDGTTDGTQLVKDIKSGPEGSGVSSLMEVGGTLYFVADDGVHGNELWTSDGTSEGTALVKDIRPGVGYSFFGGMVEMNGLIYFEATDGIHGTELWRSDGTEEGTQMVVDLTPGSAGTPMSGLTAGDDLLYFFVGGESESSGVWKSDGTEEGTEFLAKGYDSFESYSSHKPIVLGNRLYFVAEEAATRRELWTSDGTSEGTGLVKDIFPGSIASDPRFFTGVGEYVYFVANDGVHGRELWRTDGTEAGTVMVRDLNVGSAEAGIEEIVVMGDTVLLAATDGVIGKELWKVDPVTRELVLVKDIQYGAIGERLNLVVAGDKFYFVADNGSFRRDLWSSDGTPEGTAPIDIESGPAAGLSVSKYFVWGDKLFVTYAQGLTRMTLLWDGTSGGTHLFYGTPDWYYAVGDTLYMAVIGRLYKSDGTPEGTELVKHIENRGSLQQLFSPAELEGVLYFSARGSEEQNGVELWRSDGTLEGTYVVKDINPGSDSSGPDQLTKLGDAVYFIASPNGLWPGELWKTDGTAEGTISLHSLFGDEANDLSLYRIINAESHLLLFLQKGDGTYELWKSDGTPGGTEFIKAVSTPQRGDDGFHLVVGDTVYFMARDDAHGTELWSTDGTPGGTGLFRDFVAGPERSRVSNLTFFGGRVYFVATADGQGRQIWQTDGTPEGTQPAFPDAEISDMSWLTLDGSRLYVVAQTSEYGLEIFYTDLTPQLPGDFNLDGTVDTADYALWKSGYGATSGHALVADGNFDGVVNQADYAIWRNNLGRTLVEEDAALVVAAAEPTASAAEPAAPKEMSPPVGSDEVGRVTSLPVTPLRRESFRQMARGDYGVRDVEVAQSRRELLLVSREAAFASLGTTRGKPVVRGEWNPAPREETAKVSEKLAESLWGEFAAEWP